MKTKRFLETTGKAALCALCLVLLLLACVVKNPDTKPDPVTGKLPPLYVPSPGLVTASNTAAGLADAAAPVNPYAGAVDYALKAGFGLAGIIAGYVAQKRNTNAAKDQAAQKQTMLTAVIRGVEDAGTASAAVKTSIQQRATASGVQPQLDGLVQSLTG